MIETDSATGTPPEGKPPRGSAVYALRSLAVGVIVAIALGWTLLTWALSLMAMLGLFFFMLFGLLIGACMHRAGAAGRPFSKSTILTISIIVALCGWGTAVYKEAADFPRDFVRKAIKDKSINIPKGEYEKVESQLHTFIVAHLESAYPPGGILGYYRFAAAGDKIVIDLPDQPRRPSFAARTPAWVWWTRTLVSLVLLFATTRSVVGGLALAEEPTRKQFSASAREPDAG